MFVRMSILLWLILDLLIVSFAEYCAHRWLMHRPAIDAFSLPHMKHHAVYYQQFDYEPDPRGKHLNLRIGWTDTLLACLVASPLALVSLRGYAILFALALCQRWTWNAIHSEMHLAEGRWFAHLALYQWLAHRHFLHHRHPDRNYNVTLPLMDLLFGTRARETPRDRFRWRNICLRRDYD